MKAKLKAKEKLFCIYYQKLRNPKEAAIKAGYNLLPELNGTKLLERKEITDCITELEEKSKKDELTLCAAAGLKRLAFGSIDDCIRLMFADFSDTDNTEQFIRTLDLFNISEIKKPKDGSLEIKFFDRFKALEKLLDIGNLHSGEDLNGFYKALEKSVISSGKQDDSLEV